MSDDEKEAFFEAFGSIEEIKAYKAAVDELLEEKRQRKWFMAKVKTVLTWTAAIGASLLAIKGLAADIKAFLTGIVK